MPIDSNIALSFKPVQIQNPLEQYAQVQQIQAAQNHNRLADLMYGEKQREIAADNALASLLASGKSGSDITNGLATQGFGNKAISYTKQLQETEKQKADIAKTNAEAGKFNVEAAHKKLDIAGQAFGFVRANPTLENAHATLDYLGQQGIYTPEQVAQYKAQVSADPSRIAALADQAFRSAMSAKDQVEQEIKAKKFALDNANEAFSLDSNGKPVANAQYQDYQLRKAKAGKTEVNLAVNTEKGFLNEVAGGVGKALDSSMSQAKSAVNTITNINQIRSALDSGKIITGPGADTKILMKQIGVSLGLGGKDDIETLANTRSAMQAMAGQELAAADAMRGQGAITENERALIKRAAAGDINMTAPEIQALTGVIEKAARYKIQAHQENVGRLAKNPNAAPIVDFMRVDAPPAYQPKQQGMPKASASVPPAAAAYLKANPNLKAAFDAKYGPGAADSVLGQ